MRPPRNPSRRNRNIGTAKQGHGADNRLVIPESWRDLRSFYEQLRDPIVCEVEAHGDRRVVLIERPAAGNVHGCTIDDLVRLLRALPAQDVKGLDLFLFRQPTRKQRILSSVWGRFIYYVGASSEGSPAICFESQRLRPLEWPVSLAPEQVRELERLRADGHRITQGKRTIRIAVTERSLRATMLYRTALHEIGHYVDWQRSVVSVDGSEQDRERAERAFDSKPTAMKEDAAHRYATETAATLRARGELPFPVCWSSRMDSLGLERRWFVGAET